MVEKLLGSKILFVSDEGKSRYVGLKFSDFFISLLVEEGYSTCFFVAGGNSMHLLESASQKLNCIPVLNEVSAVIAAEYFNVFEGSKAFALVTAGPGISNTATGVAGAWLESREVLVVGGQVKSTDIRDGGTRQKGIQELDGVSLLSSITKKSLQITKKTSFTEIREIIRLAGEGRKGPVFLEIPLDVSAMEVQVDQVAKSLGTQRVIKDDRASVDELLSLLSKSERPLFLFGQGLKKQSATRLNKALLEVGVPVATSWTGADRLGFDQENYVGRPNLYGMRSSNLIIQKCDLLICLGSGLGLQQTGFNLDEFAPGAKIVIVDIDPAQCERPIRNKALAINADSELIARVVANEISRVRDWKPWLRHCKEIQLSFPILEPRQENGNNYVDPYKFIYNLSCLVPEDEIVVCCSSGGTFTAFMQVFRNQTNQTIISNKGLASMGYGLAGAIGSSIANPGRRVLLFEGDGGFVQNCQELGTVSSRDLPVKIFLFDNGGYASIRSSQRNYFQSHYVGCDESTGLGLPDWSYLSQAFNVRHCLVTADVSFDEILSHLESAEPVLFQIKVDPEALYLPKIQSTIDQKTGLMKSNPLHRMYPEIAPSKLMMALKFIDD